MDGKDIRLDATEQYVKLIQDLTGKAVKPYRADGYANLMTKYGTSKDSSEYYDYVAEPNVEDTKLTEIYEGNGLFAKIIDAPAEEAVKHGFELDGVKDQSIIDFYTEALDILDWEEVAINAIRWARLFGGSLAVMMINDGRGLDEPLDWRNIRSIDDIRVYERPLIQPDYTSMYKYQPADPFRSGRTIGTPEKFFITSKYGSFNVHESRCLIFKNGVLPENCTNSNYEMWGMPEYIRLKRAIQNAETAHYNGPKMLEKSVQAVYSMKDLSNILSTDEGENKVLKRLQAIDLSRNFMNTMVIDSENENYDFKTFSFTGVSEIIDTACNQLSALTSIPQTILFGRSPAGMNATGSADLENWYNYVGRLQKRMLKNNLRYLLSVVFQAGLHTGEIEEIPAVKPVFTPLWSLSELEQAQLEQTKATTQQVKAATTLAIVSMGALDPTEVRSKLAESDEYNVEEILDDIPPEDLFANMEDEEETEGGTADMQMPQENPEAEIQNNPENVRKTLDIASENVYNINEGNNQDGAPLGNDNAAKDHKKKASSTAPADETRSKDKASNNKQQKSVTKAEKPKHINKYSSSNFVKGDGDFEVTGDVNDMYLTPTAKSKVAKATSKVKSAQDLKNYLQEKGIEMVVDYKPLQNNMNKQIKDVKQQADYIITAVEQYEELGGLSALKAVHIYNPDLDAQAQYSYRAKGEGEVTDEGHLYISDRATGQQIMHEFAHAFADSTKPEDKDVVEWSAILNESAGLSNDAGAYLGARESDLEAERFADAVGSALCIGEGTTQKLAFVANVANVIETRRLATGQTEPCTGFENQEKEDIHYNKHVINDNANAYKGMTAEQYVAHAKEFLSQPCGGDIDGYVTADGYVCRYNIKTGEYAKGKPGGVLKTCMIAKCKEKTGEANLKLAQKYFEYWKGIEGIDYE